MHVNFTVHDHKENIIHSRDFVFSLSLITVQPSVNIIADFSIENSLLLLHSLKAVFLITILKRFVYAI